LGLDGVEIVVAVEEACGITITDEQAQKVVTIGDLQDVAYRNCLTRNSFTSRRCFRCKYDLHGLTSSRCPECGQPFVADGEDDRAKVDLIVLDVIAYVMGMDRRELKPEMRLSRDLGID